MADGQTSSSQTASTQQSTGTSFIPAYSESPILQSIAQYAQSMAPQVYAWGMDQFNRNQGNIDNMMRAALTYASPQRIAQEMGMAEAGVRQGAEQGRQSAIRDLQSYGVDPSSGRYAALDTANQVMSGAAAAGAGNQQRMATQAAGNAMQQQALSAGLQNVGLGYGASNAMNQLLSTGMQLKYPPLGQTTSSTGSSQSSSSSQPAGMGYGGAENWYGQKSWAGNPNMAQIEMPHGGYPMAQGGPVEPTSGGFVSHELSPSGGDHTDDVDARLNAGEFVVPKDVVDFKGREHFYKLIAQARKMRAMLGTEEESKAQTGYGAE